MHIALRFKEIKLKKVYLAILITCRFTRSYILNDNIQILKLVQGRYCVPIYKCISVR